MMYQDSVEEQRYLSNVRREKEAFEQLIRTKAVKQNLKIILTHSVDNGAV